MSASAPKDDRVSSVSEIRIEVGSFKKWTKILKGNRNVFERNSLEENITIFYLLFFKIKIFKLLQRISFGIFKYSLAIIIRLFSE